MASECLYNVGSLWFTWNYELFTNWDLEAWDSCEVGIDIMGLMRDCTHSDRPLGVALVLTFALLGEPLRIHQSMIEPSFPTCLGIPSVQYTWVYLFGDFQLSMYLLHLVRDFQLSIYLGYLSIHLFPRSV